MPQTKAPHKAGLSSPSTLRSYLFELRDKASLLSDSGETIVLNKGSTPSVLGSWDAFAKPTPMTYHDLRGAFGESWGKGGRTRGRWWLATSPRPRSGRRKGPPSGRSRLPVQVQRRRLVDD